MSSYWAGYAGTGLVLNQEEFSAFLEKYMEKNPVQAENLDEYLEGENLDVASLDDICFLKSVNAGEEIRDLQDNAAEYADKVLYFSEMSNDNVEGFRFWPFYRHDGRMNVPIKRPEGGWEDAEYRNPMWESDDVGHSCYVIWSAKDLTSPRVFEQPAYTSYEEFVQEFKDDLAAYLPDAFDWNAHLGYMSYACFA